MWWLKDIPPACASASFVPPPSPPFSWGVSPHVRSPARKPGQINGVAAGGNSATLEARDVQEDFNPLGTLPCKSAPRKSAFQLVERWGGGRLGVFAESVQALPDMVLLGASERQRCRAPGLRQSRSRAPAASSLRAAMLRFLCQRLSHRRHSSTSGSSGQDPGVLSIPPLLRACSPCPANAYQLTALLNFGGPKSCPRSQSRP